MAGKIAVAGATGNLGNRIVKALLAQGADVLALVREGSDQEKAQALQSTGAQLASVEFSKIEELSRSLTGVSCVISAVQGLRDVIVEGQNHLLTGAVRAGVPRFIPSDFSIDFRTATRRRESQLRSPARISSRARPCTNSGNFDLQRCFHRHSQLQRADLRFQKKDRRILERS